MNRRSRSPILKREDSFSMSSLSSIEDSRYTHKKSRVDRDRRNQSRDRGRDGRYSRDRERARGKESDRSKGKEYNRRGRKDSDKYTKNDKRHQSPEEDSYLKNIPTLQKGGSQGKVEKDISANKQMEMDEYMLDPSTCNFQVSFQSMEDNINPVVEDPKKMVVETNSKDEGNNRLDRLEKLVELLVTNTSKPQPSKISQENQIQDTGIFELIPRNAGYTTSMWLIKIQEACIERNLDEKSTIQFMQSKMTGILKAWFKTVSSYDFTWPELKLLIIKTFPDNTDFASTLRLLVERHKKPDETMTQYYFSKMYLLEACKILGTNAVSCLIDGLDGEQLKLQAKSGNFATPEALFSELLSTVDEYEQNYNEQDVTETDHLEPYDPEQNYLGRGDVDYRIMAKKKKKCYTCKKVGHIAADCRHAPYCYRCKQQGHIVVHCPLNLNMDNNT